ncbi:hypothetical protein MMC11_002525 [Xylographa trunciseda]|nr:hypothetical protein [Xylographa trunciseda]
MEDTFKLSDKVDEATNESDETHDSPNTSDDMDDSSGFKVTFLAENPDLPVTLPPGWPHIIDWDTVRNEFEDAELSVQGFHIANGIATVLHRYDPALLKSFLDFGIDKVTFTQKHDPGSMAIFIERNKNVVMCGIYNTFAMNGNRVLEWDIRVKYRISCSGRWLPVEYATGINARETSRNLATIADYGARLTQAMLVNQAWEECDGVKIKTTCSKLLQ